MTGHQHGIYQDLPRLDQRIQQSQINKKCLDTFSTELWSSTNWSIHFKLTIINITIQESLWVSKINLKTLNPCHQVLILLNEHQTEKVSIYIKYFQSLVKNSFRGFVLLDRQGMFRLSDEWRQWLSQVSENLILFIPIINIIIIFFSIILPLCDQVAIRVPSITLQNQTHQEFTFSSRGLLRYHR